MLIFAGGQRPSWARRLLEWAPVVALGRISYSLYLWHWPILVFARYWLIRELRTSETCLALLLSLACAVVSWRFVETPFRRWSPLPDRRSVRRAVFATTACSWSGPTVWPERVPADVARVAAGADDKDATFGSRCSSRSVANVTAGRLCVAWWRPGPAARHSSASVSISQRFVPLAWSSAMRWPRFWQRGPRSIRSS